MAEASEVAGQQTGPTGSWRAQKEEIATLRAQLAQCIADGQRMAGSLEAAEQRAEQAESTLTAADQEIAERLIAAEARVLALEAESSGRLTMLEIKGAEARSEWIRAEQAEARAIEAKREAHILALEWQARRDEMIAAQDRALGALGEYVDHLPHCVLFNYYPNTKPSTCTCGLAALTAPAADRGAS